MIAFDQAGNHARQYLYRFRTQRQTVVTIIDTAGEDAGAARWTRREISGDQDLQAIEDANVVVLVLDAQLDVSEQDATWPALPWPGCALVVAVNKWDEGHYAKDRVRREIDRKLNFLGFAKFHFISAL